MSGQDIRFEPSPWLGWQSALDQAATDQLAVASFEPPSPTPPLAARPRKLSATQIETWVRDPYGIYARFILNLRALDAIDDDPGAADRGIIIHKTLDKFVKKFPIIIPDNGAKRLMEIGKRVFGNRLEQPGVWAFWWPQFERVVEWFIDHERKRRLVAQVVGSEVEGNLRIAAPGGEFTVCAIADRIEKLEDNSLVIVDYKTGSVPRNQEIKSGFSPQLSLEAVIAEEGGFDHIDAALVSQLMIWQLAAGSEGGKVFGFSNLDVTELLAKTKEGLGKFIAAFDDPTMPYRSQPRPANRPYFSKYDHLARVKEWSASGGED